MSWIKFDTATPDKPEVWLIADCLKIDPDAVVGKLLRVWAWFDAHTEDGSVGCSSEQLIDRVAGVPGFTQAMVGCGWLKIDGGIISIQSFDKHNGATAKARADTARRVAKHKSANVGNAKVTRNTLPRPLVTTIKLRDNATCVYCGRREGEHAPNEVQRDGYMCIDHVIPITKGGSDDIRNLVCACSVCNQFKSNRTPDECGLPWPVDSEGNKFGVTSPLANSLPREEKSKNKKKEPLSHPHGSFRLPLDWQPDVNHLDLYAKHAGVSLHEITPEAITEFTGYWNANGALKPDAEWCQKLVATVKNNRGKSHGQPANTGNGQHSGSGARPSIIERGDQLSREFLQS